MKKKEVIGGGKFGEVYKGVWASNTVALKRVKMSEEEVATEAGVLLLFFHNAAILAKMVHPNVVVYYGIAVIEKEKYIMMGM